MRAIIVLAAFLASLAAPAMAQEAILTRAIRILNDKPKDPTQPTQPVEQFQPQMTAPTLTEADQRADNPAGVKVEVLPGEEVKIGDSMAIRVTTEKPGYLVVIDVDSSGRLTQIFPNTLSLADPRGAAENANQILRGKPRLIPDPQDKKMFQFTAAEPRGVGMVVAILSDKPVQMIDLPDVPGSIAGQLPALEYVRETTRTLKILPTSERGVISDPKWSFATKFYVIK